MDTGGIYIGLGSNLGDRVRHIRDALVELAHPGSIRVIHCSAVRETDPVGGPPGQGRFLNAVAELDTDLPPRALLTRLLEIEARHGRVRTVRNGARTLDLDLLLYRDQRIAEPDLIVPHPRMWERPFVMTPLSEICPASRLAAWRASLAP
jgi:2-amino-4-hydroxy-6-hydroxymethyldihydropteridine diphosphokinase